MWNQKMKAVTFSYDDGVTQDRRLVPLLNRCLLYTSDAADDRIRV